MSSTGDVRRKAKVQHTIGDGSRSRVGAGNHERFRHESLRLDPENSLLYMPFAKEGEFGTYFLPKSNIISTNGVDLLCSPSLASFCVMVPSIASPLTIGRFRGRAAVDSVSTRSVGLRYVW